MWYRQVSNRYQASPLKVVHKLSFNYPKWAWPNSWLRFVLGPNLGLLYCPKKLGLHHIIDFDFNSEWARILSETRLELHPQNGLRFHPKTGLYFILDKFGFHKFHRDGVPLGACSSLDLVTIGFHRVSKTWLSLVWCSWSSVRLSQI